MNKTDPDSEAMRKKHSEHTQQQNMRILYHNEIVSPFRLKQKLVSQKLRKYYQNLKFRLLYRTSKKT